MTQEQKIKKLLSKIEAVKFKHNARGAYGVPEYLTPEQFWKAAKALGMKKQCTHTLWGGASPGEGREEFFVQTKDYGIVLIKHNDKKTPDVVCVSMF